MYYIFACFQAPFPRANPSTPGPRSFKPVAGPCTSFTSLQEKLGHSTVNLHQFHSNNASTARTSRLAHSWPPADLFPTVSSQPLQLDKRELVPDMSTRSVPNIPFMPYFPFNRNPNWQAPRPMPNLGQSQSPHQPMQENRKKRNILYQAESDMNELLRERLKPDAWSEEELDSLWIGVRRYGHGNWYTMIQDPKLIFSMYKTPKDLAEKWLEEQRKFFYESGFKLSKPANKPGLSDDMMACFYGTRVSGIGMEPLPPSSRSLVRDNQLRIGDHYPEFQPSCMDLPSQINVRKETGTNLETNQVLPFMQKTFLSGSSTSCDVGTRDSVSFFRGTSRNSNESSRNTGAGSSKLNKLPHWLRDALSVPPPPPHPISAGPTLPPATSYAVQSLNLLDGAENSTGSIPAFKMPGPGSSFQPKDPRANLSEKDINEAHRVGLDSGLCIGARARDLTGGGAVAPPQELNLKSPLALDQETEKEASEKS